MEMIKNIFSSKVFIGLHIIITGVFIYTLATLGMIPDKYFYLIVIGAILLCVATFFLQFRTQEKSIRAIISRIIVVIICAGLIYGCVEINTGTGLLSKFTGVNYQTNAISVIVLKNSDYTKLEELDGKKLAMVQTEDQKNLMDALTDIEGQIKPDLKEYIDWNHLATALYDEKVDAIVVNETYRGMFEDKHPDFDIETRVVYQVKIKEKIENIANDGAIKDGVFNICVTGIDTFGPVSTKSRSDVNMVMTVNMHTNKILMTGIPRDYYVKLASIGQYDKLTHSGNFGVNETVNTISNLLDVKIDYYFRINFSSLVNLVDTIGGIDVYSDLTFKPLHGSRTINEGMNHFDGEMALAFSRERYAYKSGDRHRIQNQQDVMMAIIKKMMKPSILVNYQEILKKVDGTFETNMTSKDILSVIKMQLNDMKGYEMINQYLDGTGKKTYGLYSMPKSNLYTMVPNEQTVTAAKHKIDEIEQAN